MTESQYKKGLSNVLEAIESSLQERHVTSATVDHDAHDDERRTVHIIVTAGDKVFGEYFDAEQLDDCGEAVDAPAALKIRMMVSHFIGAA